MLEAETDSTVPGTSANVASPGDSMSMRGTHRNAQHATQNPSTQ